MIEVVCEYERCGCWNKALVAVASQRVCGRYGKGGDGGDDGGDGDSRLILPGLTAVWVILLLLLLLLFDLPRRAVPMVGPRISSVVSLVTWCALS